MNKIPLITNTAMRCFFIFIIVYLWLSYVVKSWLLAIVVSALITVGANAAIVAFGRRRRMIHNLTKEQSEHMQKVILQLKFLKHSQILDLFKKSLSERGTCTATSRKLKVQTNSAQIELFSLFHKEPTVADIIECLNASSKDTTVYIVAEGFNPQILNFVASFKTEIRLIDGKEVYREILAPAGVFPELKIQIRTSPRRTFAQLKQAVLSPARTKGYIFTALVIFATSFLVRFSLFYIIVATAVFSLAIASHFGPKENTNLFQ